MPNAEFHIYGEGPTRASLLILTEELSLTRRVFFHDVLPSKEIAEIMGRSDLAVVPKRASCLFGNEAASTKITEFMSLGVPLIVSRTKVDTFYHDDSMVRFFESENESDLADSMMLLWRDRQLRTQLSTNAFRYVRENSWQARQHDYLSLVDALASPSSPVRNC
jgi:glycosyltransferase involved in cell wall biosynthesis